MTLNTTQTLIKPYYTIQSPHRDVIILYNGRGKHDKLYVVAVMHHREDPTYCDVLGFYKARKAVKWNISIISKNVVAQGAVFSASRAGEAKIKKGYEVITQDSALINLGLPPLQVLCESLNVIGSSFVLCEEDVPTPLPTPEIIETEYECIDDFGVKGEFSVGCVYMGFPDPINAGKLRVETDTGKTLIVDAELFREAQKS